MDLRFLLALQEFRNGAGACLSEFFSKMTYLGDLGVAIVIMAVIYWSVEKELGAFLFMGWGANRIVNGAKMAKDTFKGVGWSAGVLTGWFLERRFVKFSTDVPLGRKLARAAAGLVGHFAVYLILGDLIKGWFPGTAGVILANFVELFFIVFLFPWFFSLAEKKEQTVQRRPA